MGGGVIIVPAEEDTDKRTLNPKQPFPAFAAAEDHYIPPSSLVIESTVGDTTLKARILHESLIDLYLSVKIRSNDEVRLGYYC